jgi:hypothetical protein
MSYIGDHVWLITSRQTDPELIASQYIEYIVELKVDDSQLVNVWVKNPVHKSNAGTLVRVLVGQFDVDLPMAAGEGC